MSEEGFDPEEVLLLKDAARRSAEKIEGSTIFLSLFTKGYREDPVCLMQLALAVLLDKPLYILAPIGEPVPENLERLARGIRRADFADRAAYEAAARWLVEQARRDGFV